MTAPERQCSRRRRATSLRRFAVCALTLGAASGCSAYSSTTRVYDGRLVEERPIRPEAYAAYLKAMDHELRGELERARAEYTVARDYDPDSADILSRLGLVTCHADYIEALELFERAQELAPAYGPAWQLAAKCALSQDDGPRALQLAHTALQRQPLSCGATAILSEVLVGASKNPSAATQLTAAHLARAETTGTGEPARLAADGSLLCQGDPVVTTAGETPPNDTPRPSILEQAWSDLDDGRPQAALTKAQLALQADPSEHNARVVALVAAERLDSPVAFHEALDAPFLSRPRRLSARAEAELLHLLERRTGYAPP